MVHSDSTTAHLQSFLAERDAPCPGCGYNLRGLTGTRCPECNQELRLQVGLVEPRLGAFIAGLVGVSTGFGFCLLLSVWLGYMYSTRNSGPPVRDAVPLFVGVVIGAIVLPLWLRGRQRQCRLPAAHRWFAAAVVTVIALACPVWFLLTAS